MGADIASAEHAFTTVIDAAQQVADYLDRHPAPIGIIHESDFPAFTLVRALTWAQMQYQAGLDILRRPATAYPAEVMLRGLIETFAQVFFIVHPSYPGTPRRKALCIELGTAKDIRKTIHEAQPHLPPTEFEGVFPSATRAAVEDNVRFYAALHDKEGCKCAGRHSGKARETLEKMAKEEDWAHYAKWAAGSIATHGNLFARYILPAQIPDTKAIGVPAPFEFRGKILFALVQTLGLIGEGTMHLLQPQDVPGFLTTAETALHLPVLAAAIDGRLDSAA